MHAVRNANHFQKSTGAEDSCFSDPAANAQPDYAEKLRKWKKDDLQEFNSQAFEEILREVYDLIGLSEPEPGSPYGEAKKTFADDILRIEICGPEQQHLSVIDVPGIFRKTTTGVTTKANVPMVRNMVSSYMQNPRSAMLAENGPTIKFSEGVSFNKTATSQEDAKDSDDGADYLRVRYHVNHCELDDLIQDDSKVAPPKETGIKSWLADVYKDSQGFEQGVSDPALLPIVWKKQSEKWDALALAYINDVVSIVHSFTVDLLSKIYKDEQIRRGLSSVILEELTERYKKGIDHTRYLLAVERSGTPLTTNHHFADNLEKW
ncbi:hypothetical protein OEA41_008951 [Lepraria neglecta]|uniref:Uncharacterized protein n=1 Tax=Lepraria neglecta TaxID=209136 RepID=A0AAD9Z402_9LECA|nr:hypothetical protein OEA41_008951 [Lepraria neglecta]